MATEVEIAQQLAKTAGLDPAVQMVLAVVGIIVMLAVPALYIVRDIRKRGAADATENSTDTLRVDLYKHLYEQVSTLTARLDKVHDENNKMVHVNALLEARVSACERYERDLVEMRKRLNEKDAVIASRDAQITSMFSQLRERDEKIINLQERLHTLEVRLARDETAWGAMP